MEIKVTLGRGERHYPIHFHGLHPWCSGWRIITIRYHLILPSVDEL
jgi:hypothetical protein